MMLPTPGHVPASAPSPPKLNLYHDEIRGNETRPSVMLPVAEENELTQPLQGGIICKMNRRGLAQDADHPLDKESKIRFHLLINAPVQILKQSSV